MSEQLAPRRVTYQLCGAGDMDGGVQDYTNTLGRHMRSEGMETMVFNGTVSDRDRAIEIFDAFEPGSIRTLAGKNRFAISNGSRNPLGGLVSRSTLETEFNIADSDLIHINAPWIPYVGGKVLTMAQRAQIPTIATYHIHSEDPLTNYAQHATRQVNGRLIDRLDHMIVVSDAAYEHEDQHYKYKGDVSVIPCGVDIDFFESAKPFEANEPFEGYDPDIPTIAFVGRPDPRKGLGELLHVATALKAMGQEFQLLIAGEDKVKTPEYMQMAKELGLKKEAHFLGRVDNERKARVSASAKLVAQLALHGESLGIVLLEAMAANAGVVMGGDNPGYRTVLGRLAERDLLLENPKNTVVFAEKMRTLLNAPVLRDKIHADQQRLVREVYASTVTGPQVKAVYDRF